MYIYVTQHNTCTTVVLKYAHTPAHTNTDTHTHTQRRKRKIRGGRGGGRGDQQSGDARYVIRQWARSGAGARSAFGDKKARRVPLKTRLGAFETP